MLPSSKCEFPDFTLPHFDLINNYFYSEETLCFFFCIVTKYAHLYMSNLCLRNKTSKSVTSGTWQRIVTQHPRWTRQKPRNHCANNKNLFTNTPAPAHSKGVYLKIPNTIRLSPFCDLFHFSRHLVLFQNINVPFSKLLSWNFDSILFVLENRSKLIFFSAVLFFLISLAISFSKFGSLWRPICVYWFYCQQM